jgi:DedD protein
VNDILKQRLVGALILVALGVVFWPIIFVQPEENNIAEVRAIPPAPGVSVAPIDAPSAAGLRVSPERVTVDESPAEEFALTNGELVIEEASIPAQSGSVTPVASPAGNHEDRTARTEAPEKLAVDSAGIPIAWTLQVATLSSSQKADVLRQELLDLNHKAYVKRIQRNDKTLYRVGVGPKFERGQIESLRANIDAKFGVKSMVARYIP